MRAIFAALLFSPFAASAATLLCDVNTPATYNDKPVQVVMNVDTQTGKVSFHTLTDVVDGTVKVTDAEFSGTVSGSLGQRYWLWIDRYTGVLALTREGHVSGQKADMWGECRSAKQRF